MDSAPGACAHLKPESSSVEDSTDSILDVSNLTEIRLFGSSIWKQDNLPVGDELYLIGLKKPAIVHDDGLFITANDGVSVCILDF